MWCSNSRAGPRADPITAEVTGRESSFSAHSSKSPGPPQQDPDSCQSRQLLTELLKLTEHLVAKLSTVNQTSGNQEEPYVDSPHTSRPSLRLAQLELLNGLPKPRVGPWWPCPMDNIVEVAYDEICASVWNLQQEECFFREAGLGIGPTALDRERPSLGPALPSGPELELPGWGSSLSHVQPSRDPVGRVLRPGTWPWRTSRSVTAPGASGGRNATSSRP
nr:uncharacterized protein LOC127486572 isoform X1 [Oryctolagus cuniculus]XP_051697569.1 uncharacterized protein LOC127489807 isoform X1 [Oryctolagus cuniculus]